MGENDLWNALWDDLFADIADDEEYFEERPLLAHYTSLEALEKILRNEELWLSNPLLMNDLEEVRFGVIEGSASFKSSIAIREALKTEEHHLEFVRRFDDAVINFEREHLLDTYVFCTSFHPADDRDGSLSMWRGYGGNGRGAAIVFDTARLTPLEQTPLILAKVKYATAQERYVWFDVAAKRVASFLERRPVSTSEIHFVASALFERLKVFALFTKHLGFAEEREWRLVYLRDRDVGDRLSGSFHYVNGSRGVEPKLRLKIAPMDGVMEADISLEKIISRIILGPSISSPLMFRSVERMLDVIKKSALRDKLCASTIPYRCT